MNPLDEVQDNYKKSADDLIEFICQIFHDCGINPDRPVLLRDENYLTPSIRLAIQARVWTAFFSNMIDPSFVADVTSRKSTSPTP